MQAFIKPVFADVDDPDKGRNGIKRVEILKFWSAKTILERLAESILIITEQRRFETKDDKFEKES